MRYSVVIFAILYGIAPWILGCTENPSKQPQTALQLPIKQAPSPPSLFGEFKPIKPPSFEERFEYHPRDHDGAKEPVPLSPHYTVGRVTCLRFSPDASRLLVTMENGAAELWDIAARKSIAKTSTKGEQSIRAAEFSPDGNRIVLADESGTLTVWDPAKPEQSKLIDAYSGSIAAVAWGADPRLIATGAADGTCAVLNIVTGQNQVAPRNWLTGDSQDVKRRINALAISPDCQQLFVGMAPSGSGILDVDPLDLSFDGGESKGTVLDAAFSSTGRILATISREGWLMVKDLHPPLPEKNSYRLAMDSSDNIGPHTMSVLRFLPGDKQLVIYHGNTAFHYYSVEHHSRGLQGRYVTPTTIAIAVAPDARTAAYAEASGQIHLWEIPAPVNPQFAQQGAAALDPEEPLEKANFEELEHQFAEARKSRTVRNDGTPELYLLYSKYSDVPKRPARSLEARYEKKIALLEKWSSQIPDSITPRLLLANVYSSWGWVARGTGSASSLSEDQVDLLRERLMKSGKVLVDVSTHGEIDAEYYRAQLSAGLGLGLPKDVSLEIFKKGVTVDPTYTPLYLAISNYLLPRWYGELGDIAELAESQYRAAGGGDEGLIRYALIAEHAVHADGIAAVPAHRFSMPKLVQGMYLLYDRYRFRSLAQETAIAVMLLAKQRARFRGFNPRVEQLNPSMWGDTDLRDHLLAWHANKPMRVPNCLHIPACFSKINKIAYTEGDTRLLVAASDPYEVLTLWDAKTGENRTVKFLPMTIASFDHSTDRKHWALAGGNDEHGVALVWNRAIVDDKVDEDDSDEEEFTPLDGHKKFVRAIAFSSDDEWVAVAGHDLHVRVHHLRDNDKSFDLPVEARVEAVIFSLDGKQLAAISSRAFFVWDLATQERIETGLDEKHTFTGICRSGQSALIADEHHGGIAYDFAQNKHEPLVAFEKSNYSQFVTAIAISPDRSIVAFGRSTTTVSDPAEKYSIDLWQAKPWKHLTNLAKVHRGEITSLAFTTNGKRLASGAQDGSLAQWYLQPILKPLVSDFDASTSGIADPKP